MPTRTRDDATLASVQEGFIRLMRFASRPAVHQALRQAAGVELDRSAYAIVARIAEFGPIRSRDLAELLAVDPSTLSRQLARLVELGLVARVEDPDDGRAQQLTVLPAGEEILARFRGVWRAWLDDALHDWSAHDRDTLAELLPRFVDALSTTPVPG